MHWIGAGARVTGPKGFSLSVPTPRGATVFFGLRANFHFSQANKPASDFLLGTRKEQQPKRPSKPRQGRKHSSFSVLSSSDLLLRAPPSVSLPPPCHRRRCRRHLAPSLFCCSFRCCSAFCRYATPKSATSAATPTTLCAIRMPKFRFLPIRSLI